MSGALGAGLGPGTVPGPSPVLPVCYLTSDPHEGRVCRGRLGRGDTEDMVGAGFFRHSCWAPGGVSLHISPGVS